MILNRHLTKDLAVVDDRLPVASDGTLLAASSRSKSVWLPILEKAVSHPSLCASLPSSNHLNSVLSFMAKVIVSMGRKRSPHCKRMPCC